MFLNDIYLERIGARPADLAFFKKYFPNGAELSDVIALRQVPYEFLHWLFAYLPFSEEEKTQYYERLNIFNSSAVSNSHHVAQSTYVSESANVVQSHFVLMSTDIKNCKEVVSSESVEDSSGIFNSTFVYNSNRVVFSSDVNDSNNIVHGRYIVKSRSVFDSELITCCESVRRSKALTDCYFCTNCQYLKNSLFCTGIQQNMYQIFNETIEVEHFENIMKMYLKIMNNDLNLMDDWDPEFVVPIVPNVHYDPRKHYSTLSAKARKWLESLPHFNPQIMYRITYLPEFIKNY